MKKFEEEKPSQDMMRKIDELDKGEMVQVLSGGYPTKERKDFYSAELVRKNFISKQKVKEFIKLEQELIKSLATRKQIEGNPLNKKIREKIKELGLE